MLGSSIFRQGSSDSSDWWVEPQTSFGEVVGREFADVIFVAKSSSARLSHQAHHRVGITLTTIRLEVDLSNRYENDTLHRLVGGYDPVE